MNDDSLGPGGALVACLLFMALISSGAFWPILLFAVGLIVSSTLIYYIGELFEIWGRKDD